VKQHINRARFSECRTSYQIRPLTRQALYSSRFSRPKKDEMTPEEKELMDALCKRIAVEHDPKTFDALVHQLNELLEKKEHRLNPGQGEKPS
jgi:hypothetical protein